MLKAKTLRILRAVLRKSLFLTGVFGVVVGLFVAQNFDQIQMMRVRAAATIFWDGNSDGDGDNTSWNDPLNWSEDRVPNSTDEVLIETTSTVNIVEPITIAALNVGRIDGSTTPVLNFAYDAISGGPLTVTTGDINVYTGAKITHTVGGVNVGGTISIDVQNGNLYVAGAVDANGKGHTTYEGPGGGKVTTTTHYSGGGGGYGGVGGVGHDTSPGGGTYGSYSNPTHIGSGGGLGGGYGGGAIKLNVSGTLTVTVGGTISANGNQGQNNTGGWNDYGGGGGSGGSVWIITNTLTGTGKIQAIGGVGGYGDLFRGGGGGGGRIAIYYTNDNSQLTSLSASGNGGYLSGGAGTLYKKAAGAVYGDLILDNSLSYAVTDRALVGNTPLTYPLTFDNLTIANYSRMEATGDLTVINQASVTGNSHLGLEGSFSATDFDTLTNSHVYVTEEFSVSSLDIHSGATIYNEQSATITYDELLWAGGKIIDNGGTMEVVSGGGDLLVPSNSVLTANAKRTFTNIIVQGTINHSANSNAETYKIDYTSTGDFYIDSAGAINVNGLGYATSLGPGGGQIINTNTSGGGGGYGGKGGTGYTVSPGGGTYGSKTEPINLGSGGGHGDGHGAGAVKLTVTGTTTVLGSITANGAQGKNNTGGWNDYGGGGGSGGSVWIITSELAGTGRIEANGGVGGFGDLFRGGGGGGGRIALYYSNYSANFNTLTATGGPGYEAGEDGTIYYGGSPVNPVNLRQFKSDGTTAVSQGTTVNEDSMVMKFQVADSDASDTLIPEVEIQPLGTPFVNVATDVGEEVEYSGSTVTATVTVTGLADATSYHWQARVCDVNNLCSGWVSFGTNTEEEADVSVVLNTSPSAPVIPSSSTYINGQFTNDTTPTLSFVLSDPNPTDTVKYQIQISTSDDFSSPLIDFVSGFGAQTTHSYTVGQDATGLALYNAGEDVEALDTGNYYWRVKTIDDKNGQSGWTTAPGNPAFQIDLTLPVNASEMRMKSHAASGVTHTVSTADIWFSRPDPYFAWNAGSDAQGVKGYCAYLGTDPDADPAQEKGILGSSPVSVSGTTCQFIIDGNEIDFANTALRGQTWLNSSETPYFFKVKTIDNANNVAAQGPEDTNVFSFYFDGTPPAANAIYTDSSTSFSSINEMHFLWAQGAGETAADQHSGVLGFQYAINTLDTWYGGETDDFTGFNYYPMNTTQPFYLTSEVADKIQLGWNYIYMRVIDKAGNISENRSARINYGGAAPGFEPGARVTVTPEISTENKFSFSWPEAIPGEEGRTILRYYYMINTPPPTSLATIKSNSATYIATEQRVLENVTLTGLRKGSNTITVVVIDDQENYSPGNAIEATFELNTDLPDPPLNLVISDASVKEASLWRAAIAWSEPEYKGTGSLTYTVQRSEDGNNWTTVATTSGQAYVDTVPASKQYYWRVAAADNSDESIASPSYANPVSIIPRGTYKEPAPLSSGPATTSITTRKATVTWSTGRTSDSKVAYGEASNDYFDDEAYRSEHVTDHTIQLTNLKPGTKYYYKAKWTDEDGNTGESEEKTFDTQPAPVVKDVVVKNIGIASALVEFTVKDATKVKVYYGESTSFGGIKEVSTSTLEATYSVELGGLSDDTKYYFKLNTFDMEDAEYEGTILDFTTMPRPRISDVRIQQVAKTAQSTLQVTWLSNTSISSVISYYPEGQSELERDAVDIELVDGEHQMLVRGLFPDTTYVIRVSGRDVIGNEATSEILRFTTATDTRPPLISDVVVEGANIPQVSSTAQQSSAQLIVSWTTDEPATSQVEYAEGTGAVYTQVSQEDQTLAYNHVVIISGLTPSKVYHLRAISKDAASNEAKSIDVVTITPKATDNAFDLVITNLREVFSFLSGL